MIFLLDTNAFSDLMRERLRLASIVAPDRVAICSIVRGKIRYGIERLPRGRGKAVAVANGARETERLRLGLKAGFA